MSKLNPQNQTNKFTLEIQRKIYDIYSMDSDDISKISSEFSFIMRNAFLDEIRLQLIQLGCTEEPFLNNNSSIYLRIKDESLQITESVINTFNYRLASKIDELFNLELTKNEITSELETWVNNYIELKKDDLSFTLENVARYIAQTNFTKNNNLSGYAELHPKIAKEPICQGWINRGKVSIPTAMSVQTPIHFGCPHFWLVFYNSVADCRLLWRGE